MKQITIQEVTTVETTVFETFLYLAIYQTPNFPLLAKQVIYEPSLYQYIKEFGRSTDIAIIAKKDHKIIGIAWARCIHAYGYVGDHTPEIAIAVVDHHRGHGIGTQLIKKLQDCLTARGYQQASLSVSKENPAIRLYRRMGYQIVREHEADIVMLNRSINKR